MPVSRKVRRNVVGGTLVTLLALAVSFTTFVGGVQLMNVQDTILNVVGLMLAVGGPVLSALALWKFFDPGVEEKKEETEDNA